MKTTKQKKTGLTFIKGFIILTLLSFAFKSNAQCNASFTYVITGNQVQFTSTATILPSNSFWWYFNDGVGSVSYALNPTHVFTSPGVYYATLIIMDTLTNDICDSTAVQITILSTSCNSHFSFSSTNGTVSFTNLSSSGGSNTYASTWSFGDMTSSNSQNPVHTYTTSGWYTVCLYIYDSIVNCSSTYCDSVYINTPATNCQAAFTYVGNYNIINFTNTSSNNATSYSWSFGDGSTSSSSNPTHQYNNAGWYSVCLTITDSITNCTDTYCSNIYAYFPVTPCYAYFEIDTQTTVGNNYEIYNSSYSPYGPGAVNYLWDFGDGTTSTLATPTHNYTGSGPYYVCLTISDTSGVCNNTYCDSFGNASGAPVVIVVRSSVTTNVDEIEILSSLENYPNPFNGTTTISYVLQKDAFVQIKVLDLLGKTVAIIESSNKSSGKQSVDWNAENVQQGMYLIQVIANDKASTKRIIIK